MKNKYILTTSVALIISLLSFSQDAKFFIDFEAAEALSNLPSGVTSVNGSNTVRVKNTTDFEAIPNAVQDDPDATGENELFLDFHGYLKLDLTTTENFSLAYDYRRTNDNDDWWLGFLTFIGNDGTDNRLEQILIREWDGQLNYADTNTGSVKPISFNTNYHVVLTSSNGDVKVYVNDVEVLNVPYTDSGKNIQTWTNASVLISYKGNSFDGTSVSPESEYNSNARDTRVYIDNIALFDREISSSEVSQLYNNGNNSLGVLSLTENSIINKSIKLYPNPLNSSDKNINLSSDKVKSIEIFNILGAKILAKKVVNSAVNVNQLPSGIYMVKSFDNNGNLLNNQKLIKH